MAKADKEYEVIVTDVIETRYRVTAAASHLAAMKFGEMRSDDDLHSNETTTISTKISKPRLVSED